MKLSFIYYLNSLNQCFHCKMMVFSKSVQLGHLNCKWQNENKRNLTRKSGTMFPLSRVKVSPFNVGFLVEKDKSYMHHCSKQMSKWSEKKFLTFVWGKLNSRWRQFQQKVLWNFLWSSKRDLRNLYNEAFQKSSLSVSQREE